MLSTVFLSVTMRILRQRSKQKISRSKNLLHAYRFRIAF